MLAILLLAGCHGLTDPFGGLDMVRCPARLLPGDLVITEIMASPGPAGAAPAGEEAPGKWIEIYNPTDHPIDLQGVVLALGSPDQDRAAHAMEGSVIAPGQYLVLGSGAPGAGPGMDLGALPDTGGRVALKCDVIVVDEVVYPAMAPGIARGLSGAIAPDAKANDQAGNWCAATEAFEPGRMGSPGAANEVCAGVPGSPDGSGRCNHGGSMRDQVVPRPGDLVISEVMANPNAASDSVGEWIELHVAADVDLNGLAVGREPGKARGVLAAEACLRAARGSQVLIAASADPAINGGLPPVDHVVNLGLVNSNGAVFIGIGETVLDQVAWGSSRAGASLSLDPGALLPDAGDDLARWCTNTRDVYGKGDTGTPGAPNPPCAAPPAGDACQDGDAMRPIVRPAPGELRITEYMPNPEAVSDALGEWIELRVDADVDLNGLELGKEPGAPLVKVEAAACLRVAAGTRVVLARNLDPAVNGGLDQVTATFGFSLVNSNGSLFVGAGGQVLDSLRYTASTAGVATSLDEDDGVTWCPSPAGAYGPGDTGDRGTPGAPNPRCGEALASDIP